MRVPRGVCFWVCGFWLAGYLGVCGDVCREACGEGCRPGLLSGCVSGSLVGWGDGPEGDCVGVWLFGTGEVGRRGWLGDWGLGVCLMFWIFG